MASRAFGWNTADFTSRVSQIWDILSMGFVKIASTEFIRTLRLHGAEVGVKIRLISL